MKAIDIVAAPLGQLGASYRTAALEHAAATAAGRHRLANRNHDLIASIVRELRTRGRDGEKTLENLLRDKELAVRVWAATHCLAFAPADAERVLSEAAAGPPSPVRLAAEMTLSEWKAGRL